MEKKASVFRVVKLSSGMPIKAYKTFGHEIGAEMDTESFLTALVEGVGTPTFIMTKKQLLERLRLAASEIQDRMQQATASVAGLSVKSSE
jgi:hypothetical protein